MWVIFLINVSIWISQGCRQEMWREKVLQANPHKLQELGQRFILGYRDFEEIKLLVEYGAVGGVYITRRNIQGKTFSQVQNEIALLQHIQKKAGRPALIVAADQEGGIVSHLSPLLTQLPPLSEVIQNKSADDRWQATENYATLQAQELSKLGITLNLGPVADLKMTLPDFKDKHSLISKRAISEDPHIISEVGTTYCQTLTRWNISSTLKHFPGLGRVQGDSHFTTLKMPTDISVLAETDWLPFKYISQNCNSAAIMVSHIILPDVDPHHPASVSHKVVDGIMRRHLNLKGKLLTDDFSMGPIVSRPGGIGKASLDALNAGIDNILISYDNDLYYPAMAYLLQHSKTTLQRQSTASTTRD